GRIELAAAAKPGLLNAEIGPRRGQQGVEAVALRRRRAVGIQRFAQRHREALTDALRNRGDLDRAQFGVGGAGVTVGIERRPTAAGERDSERQPNEDRWPPGGMPAGRRRSRRARKTHSGHEIDDAVRHDDDFLRRTPGELMRDLRQSERRLFDIARRSIARQFDSAAKLAVYLY